MNIISIDNGVAVVSKTCKGCGQPFNLEIPVGQVESEVCNDIRCIDCVSRLNITDKAA